MPDSPQTHQDTSAQKGWTPQTQTQAQQQAARWHRLRTRPAAERPLVDAWCSDTRCGWARQNVTSAEADAAHQAHVAGEARRVSREWKRRRAARGRRRRR